MRWRPHVARALTGRLDLPVAGVRADWETIPLNGERLVVRGRERHPVPETLYATSYTGELRPSLRQALGYLLAPSGQLVLRERILGGMSVEEHTRQGARDQELSVAAALAAGAHLGLPGRVHGKGVLVEDVDPDGPNAGKVTPGDVITVVRGQAVRTLPELLALVEGHAEAQVTLTTAQDGRRRPLEETTTLTRCPVGTLGLSVATHRQVVEPGVDVEVRFPPDVGGPSTGLVLALSILDVLTPGSLTGSRRVGGTGAIGPDGEVLEVGGVKYKTHTALSEGFDLFLVPESNLAEALSQADGRAEVVGVTTLAETVDELVRRGGDRPRLAEGSPR